MRNYARFYALLKRMPGTDREELKKDLVLQYTNGRTESLKEVTDKEYDAMCNAMQDTDGRKREREIYRENLRRKRSNLLKQMQKMGIDTTDWNAIDSFCMNPRISGKVFRNLTVDELDEVFIKLKIISRKDRNQTDKSLLN